MDWYSIRITKEESLQVKADRLFGEVRDLLRGVETHPTMAVYSSIVNDQAVDVYFSPEVATLAMGIIHRYWGCQSTAPPLTAKLLLGSPTALTSPQSAE